MYAAIIQAKVDDVGPDITGKIVPMLSGTRHIVSMNDINFYLDHPDAFTVLQENIDAPLIPVRNPITNAVIGLSDPGSGANVLFGAMADGTWMRVPSIFRLRLAGTGTVTIDSKDSLGNITTGVAGYTVSGATDQIKFPYAGDNAVMIRATLTGSATAEVI